jgi:hypothetical protein
MTAMTVDSVIVRAIDRDTYLSYNYFQ